MARYSVRERIGRAIVALVMLLVVLALGYAFAPGSVIETPISQLSAGKVFLAGAWTTIMFQCLRGVGVLLFEAIAGREQMKDEPAPNGEPRATSNQSSALERKPFPLPVWLKRERPWQGRAARRSGGEAL